MRKSDEYYKTADFSDEQKLFFLTKAAVVCEYVRSFVVMHAPSSCTDLEEALMSYKESSNRSCLSQRSAPGVRFKLPHDKVFHGEVRSVKRKKNAEKIEALASHSTEFSLLVKKAKIGGNSGPASPARTLQNAGNKIPRCGYFGE